MQKQEWKGKHNGTVRGKSFEASRRNRKSHAQRKAGIVSASLSQLGYRPAKAEGNFKK